MIYFLLNNDYHRLDFELHAPSLVQSGLHVIEIKHTLKKSDNSKWGHSSRFEPDLDSGVFRALVSRWQTAQLVRRRITPTQGDVLFLYTEFEPLNQLVVQIFRGVGARVYLIEDGGIATYVTFRNALSEDLSFRELILRRLYRCLPGAGQLRMQKIAGNIYPWMPDESFNGVCLYRPISIGRQIPIVHLLRPVENNVHNCDPGRIVFLNQDLYAFSYLTDEEYLDVLRVVIEGLAKNFAEILFKFHPRETERWRGRIVERVLSKWGNITCLSDQGNIESSLSDLAVGMAASFNSTALMNLAYRGVQPVFLYHLFPVLTRHADFQQNTSILTDWGYKFVGDMSEVVPSYRSGLRDVHVTSDDRYSIDEIVETDG